MNTKSKEESIMPAWLQAAMRDAQDTDGVLNKRGEKRWALYMLCKAQPLGGGQSFTVRLFNVSENGVGLITRQELRDRDEIQMEPLDDFGERVALEVVHCTATLQGYKVGCRIIPFPD